MSDSRRIGDDPLWYKDAIIYQVHVKAFYDSNGDGMGDFRGLIEKLDYLAELGVTAIWMLPFYPSPLRDDGYDIADYFDVHPDYGVIQDLRELLREAHRRGMRVITELVLNHTSDQHAWFQRARRAKPGTAAWDFYVWSDDPSRYRDARIIFKDFEVSNWAFDPLAGSSYWHRFYSHQPDLNFDNPQVHKALFRVIDFWLGMGVDGLRLDAVPYLYEREGTNCENLPETHEFLKKLRAHIDGRYKNRMLLAEANQWPEDAVAYFGVDGDECQMCFHFPVMPRMFMALMMEDRFPVIDILQQTPAIPENSQWGLFLRNHDELTLEMVTDEERDYMYRVYARDPRARINLGIRRRLAPLIGNNRRMYEIMKVLLFTLPGTPIIYYGDEIGMGDNYYLGDRNGVRTPMQWSPDKNAGFSRANPQQLYFPVIIDPEYHYESVNVENQAGNPSSLLWWMRGLIAMRKRFKAFGRGSIRFLLPDNPRVLAYIREYQDETILVTVNLSRFPQFVELDLTPYAGQIPEEVFSGNRFPAIDRDDPYRLTLGPHGWFIFIMRRPAPEVTAELERTVPEMAGPLHLGELLDGEGRRTLEQTVLPRYLASCRWFAGKARRLRSVAIVEEIVPERGEATSRFLILRVVYAEGPPERYLLPVTLAGGERGDDIRHEAPQSVIAVVVSGENRGIICDAVYDDEFRGTLLRLLVGKKRVRGREGELAAVSTRAVRRLARGEREEIASSVLKVEQSNSSIRFDCGWFLKLYRKLEEGINPDAELVRYLTEIRGFGHVPSFVGALEYRRNGERPTALGLLQEFVPNEGDAWSFTLSSVTACFEKVLAACALSCELPPLPQSLLDPIPAETEKIMGEMCGEFFIEMTALLGRRTAEMHLALAAPTEDAQFTAEPFSLLYQRSLFQAMRSLTRRSLHALGRRSGLLSGEARELAERVLAAEEEMMAFFGRVTVKKIEALKTRTHGDYHLGQVLFTGKDFIIIDFEGEPARPLGERRLKRSPFRDVAGMIRSFHYAAWNVLLKGAANLRPEDRPLLDPWAGRWYHHTAAIFLKAYLETAAGAPFVPRNREDLETLVGVMLLEKAVYEVGYEINNRPDWVVIPLRGILDLLGQG